jgi:hypothetical protein
MEPTIYPSILPEQHGFFNPGYLTKKRRTNRNEAEFRYNAEQIEKMAEGFEKAEVKLWELIGSLRAWQSENASGRARSA